MEKPTPAFAPLGGTVLAVKLASLPKGVPEGVANQFNREPKAEFFTVVYAGPRAMLPPGAMIVALDTDRKTVKVDGAEYRTLTPEKIIAMIEVN